MMERNSMQGIQYIEDEGQKEYEEGFSMDFTNLPLGSEYTILQMKRSNEQKSMRVYVCEREKKRTLLKITEEK